MLSVALGSSLGRPRTAGSWRGLAHAASRLASKAVFRSSRIPVNLLRKLRVRTMFTCCACSLLSHASGWPPASGAAARRASFRLDRAAIAPQDFDNALFQTVGVQLRPGNQVEVVNNGRVFD